MIHEHVRPLTLGFVRVYVFLIWLVKIVPDPVSLLAELPISIFKPVGILRLVPDIVWHWLFDARILSVFKAVLIVSLVLAMIGARPYRPIAILSAILLTLHQGLVRSFTFVNHQELAILFSVYVLAIFPAADGFALARRNRSASPPQIYAAALLTMTVLLLLPYSAIGAFRLANSAPAVFFDNSLAYWLGSLSGLDADGWSLGAWTLKHPMLVSTLKLGFPVVTCFETLAPLCLILPRFRRLWLAVMIPFHCLSWLLLNIFFWENLLLIAVLLTDVDDWLTRCIDRVRDRAKRLSALNPI